MSRKTHKYSLVAVAAIAGIGFIAADFSSATAQANDQFVAEVTSPIDQTASGSTEVVPVFVSQEVVQLVPEPVAEIPAEATPAPSASSLRALVIDVKTPDTLSEQMQCLAGAVYFESRGEPLAGQLAVAQVIINRTEAGAFPSSYCGVVYQRSQFSFVKNGRMPKVRTGSTAWKRAKAIARIAHEGMWESEADDSLYFHAKYVRPSWSRKKTARATINTHIFYR